LRGVIERENHEKAWMALESLIEKRPGYTSGFVRQQLGFDAMNAGRLLQSLDHMGQQPDLYIASICGAPAVRDEKIADYPLAALINEKAVPENKAAFDRGVTGKDFRIDVAQNHFRRAGVVPREQVRPNSTFVIEQGTQIHGRKMPEVENLHEGSRKCGHETNQASLAMADVRV